MNTWMRCLAILTVSATVVVSCTADDPLESFNSGTPGSVTGGGSSGGSGSAVGELTTFAVSIDQTTAEPATSATAYYPEAEDNLEDSSNSEFADGTVAEVAIDMSGAVSGTVNGVSIVAENGNIVCDHGSSKVCYVVSGSTASGSLTIKGEKKCEVKLSGVSITSPDSAALNILCKKRAFVYLVPGTTNSLTDTETDNEHKGALYAKGKLLFHGSGSLSVYGRHNNAIHSADYIIFNPGVNIYANSTANHGIKANDGVFINGGILNVEVSAAAAKGINSESDITVNGGRTTVITTGNGVWDTEDKEAKGAACLKSDLAFTINGGELWLRSTGSGGKGIKADTEGHFNGGSTYVITTGSQFRSNNDTASPKGVKTDGNVTVSGGRIWVRTSGTNGEGIESKGTLDISGGEVASYAYDDAINSKSHTTISGGYIFALGQHNDGIDANGNCYIKGGVIYASCSGSPEVAIDANTEGGYKLYLQGGTVVAIGGLENGSSLSQACYQSSWSRNSWYALTYGDNTLAFQTPSSGGSGLVVSTPSTPALKSGVTVSGGTDYFGGLVSLGCTVSGGSSVTLSSYSGGGGRR